MCDRCTIREEEGECCCGWCGLRSVGGNSIGKLRIDRVQEAEGSECARTLSSQGTTDLSVLEGKDVHENAYVAVVGEGKVEAGESAVEDAVSKQAKVGVLAGPGVEDLEL